MSNPTNPKHSNSIMFWKIIVMVPDGNLMENWLYSWIQIIKVIRVIFKITDTVFTIHGMQKKKKLFE